MKILLAYATLRGSTAEVAEFMGHELAARHIDVTVARAGEVKDVSSYDVFLLGTSIYRGMWLTELIDFVNRFAKDIGHKPVFGWVNCLHVLEHGGYEQVMRNYLPNKTLSRLNVQDYRIFAGRLHLDSEVDWRETWALALHFDGKAFPEKFDGDFRDWDAIADWMRIVASRLNVLAAQAG